MSLSTTVWPVPTVSRGGNDSIVVVAHQSSLKCNRLDQRGVHRRRAREFSLEQKLSLNIPRRGQYPSK